MVSAGGAGRPRSEERRVGEGGDGRVTVRSGPAFSATGLLTSARLTITCASSNAHSAPSLAVRRRMYVPEVENVAVVVAAFGGENVTVPGPLVRDQVMVSAGGAGRP